MLTLCSPMLPSQMRTPIAVTETAGVGTGWGGGGEGVGRARSAAGATTLITFGYQPKASGKGTGCDPVGRRPDLKADA